MKTVLLLGGPAAGQRVEVHGNMGGVWVSDTAYKLVPMCSHGEVHWFGVLDGADPLALLIAGYAPAPVANLSAVELSPEDRALVAAVNANTEVKAIPNPLANWWKA